jgi:hypothetical protein
MELFNSSLKEKTKMKGVLEILTSASEFSTIPVQREILTSAYRERDPHLRPGVFHHPGRERERDRGPRGAARHAVARRRGSGWPPLWSKYIDLYNMFRV